MSYLLFCKTVGDGGEKSTQGAGGEQGTQGAGEDLAVNFLRIKYSMIQRNLEANIRCYNDKMKANAIDVFNNRTGFLSVLENTTLKASVFKDKATLPVIIPTKESLDINIIPTFEHRMHTFEGTAIYCRLTVGNFPSVVEGCSLFQDILLVYGDSFVISLDIRKFMILNEWCCCRPAETGSYSMRVTSAFFCYEGNIPNVVFTTEDDRIRHMERDSRVINDFKSPTKDSPLYCAYCKGTYYIATENTLYAYIDGKLREIRSGSSMPIRKIEDIYPFRKIVVSENNDVITINDRAEIDIKGNSLRLCSTENKFDKGKVEQILNKLFGEENYRSSSLSSDMIYVLNSNVVYLMKVSHDGQ